MAMYHESALYGPRSDYSQRRLLERCMSVGFNLRGFTSDTQVLPPEVSLGSFWNVSNFLSKAGAFEHLGSQCGVIGDV